MFALTRNRFEGPPPGDKMSGTLHVTIREGRNLTAPGGASTADPYVKLYLSKVSLFFIDCKTPQIKLGSSSLTPIQDGKDIKTTKQKTKHQRNTLDPLFEERLIVYLQPGTALDDKTRLQITVQQEISNEKYCSLVLCGSFFVFFW